MAHAAGGLLVLLAATPPAVYKPQGMTRYGARKQHEQRALLNGDTGVEPGYGSTTRTPRWVKVFGIIVIVLVLLVGIMMLSGGHGPGAHAPSGG